jgi:hypothetical protein
MTKHHIFFLIGTLFLVFTVFQGCYYDEVLPEPVVVDVNEEVRFSQDIIPIFKASCNFSSCHNTGDQSPDLTPANAHNSLINGGYINTETPKESELYQWLIGNRHEPMPPTGPDATINAKILAWITQGAKNN